MRKFSLWTIAAALGLWFSVQASAQESFYKGKTVRILVGGSAGGGYDTYTRTIARHLGKHIPGNPSFVVENMTGAGSLIAANYTYKIARPDGLTIGHFIGGLMLQQVMGKPGIEFEGQRFEYLGVPAQDSLVLGVTKAAGITSVEQWLATKTTLKIWRCRPRRGHRRCPQSSSRHRRCADSTDHRLQRHRRHPPGDGRRRTPRRDQFMGIVSNRDGAKRSNPVRCSCCCRHCPSAIPNYPTFRRSMISSRTTMIANWCRPASSTTAPSPAPTHCRRKPRKIGSGCCARDSPIPIKIRSLSPTRGAPVST